MTREDSGSAPGGGPQESLRQAIRIVWQRVLPEPGPVRPLAVATFVNVAGNGALMTAGALYFTRILGLSAAQVGIGLTIAGLVGLFAGIPVGQLSDRVGARELLMVLLVALGAVWLGFIWVHGFVAFVVLASVMTFLDRGSAAVYAALIAGAVSGERRVHTRAYLRSIGNLGVTIGTALAGIALHFDSKPAYVVLLVVNSASFVVTAFLVRAVPRVAPVSRHARTPFWTVLRDKPYIAIIVLTGLLTLHYGMLEIAVPLWVANHTSAPTWLVSVLFAINTIAVVLFQVRVSRVVDVPASAAKVTRAAGFVLLAACGLYAAASQRSMWLAVVLLLAAGCVHVLGEMYQVAAQYCLAYDLAPDQSQGQYQGAATSGFGIMRMIAPTVVVFLPIGLGVPGWLALGAIFAVSGMLTVPATAWALRTRGQMAPASGRGDSQVPVAD